MRTVLFVAIVALTAACGFAGEQGEGPVADYRFDEGTGTTLHDRSPAANHAAIHGAAWVRCGEGFALRLDGKDDYVDCGSPAAVDLTKAVSVEAWVLPEAVPGAGEPGVVGKSYGSYVLTHYTDGRFWWYISGGGNNCKAAASIGAWHHLVGTFDGRLLKLYVDGALADTTASKAAAIARGGRLLLGTSEGDRQLTRGAHFQGMITEVRIYDRALRPEEVARHYRSTRLTGEIGLRPYVYPASGTIVVEADLRALGELPRGAMLAVELLRRGGGELAVTGADIGLLPAQGPAEATLRVGELAAGGYELRAAVTAKDGSPVGRAARLPITWPARPQWKDVPGAKVLNNLVTELLSVTSPEGAKPLEFTCPREGWAFITSTAGKGAAGKAGPVSITLDGRALYAHQGPGTLEAMRYLAKGPHQLRTSGPGGLERLVVRAIPELVFSKFGADPHVHEYGKYDWEFLSRHVLPNINVLVATGAKDQEPHLRQWKRQGKRVLAECGVPGLRGTEPVTAEDAWKYWSAARGMSDPLFDGVLADEFWGGLPEAKLAAWTEAVRRIRGDARFKGKVFYPYCAPMYGAEPSRRFLREVTGAGWRFAFERYLPEPRDRRAARAYLDTALRHTIASWRREMPGAEAQMIVCLGTFSQPPESLDVDPGVNHKVFLDVQLNLLANHPDCFGLGGVMTYLSSYTDEETVRWMGRLFRHYCIEGRCEPLSGDPYVLPHLDNGDFEDGTRGWTVAAAEPGSVEARTSPGFSWLQGRYPRTNQGNTVLWMKRSPKRPNAVSQQVKSLEPGRLYTLRFYSGDYRDQSVKQKHAISVELAGAEVLHEKSFQHVFANCYSHHHGPFDRQHRAWMNYRWLVFRAKGTEATLRISDWAGPTSPGGPAGQELMINFVQVQPYD